MRRLLVPVLMLAPLWAVAEPIPSEDLSRLPYADVVLLGEVHENPQHHANQARAIAALHPTAVVWEMLTSEQAARMPDDRTDAVHVAEALGWEGTGWPDFALYHPLITAAGPARHFGAAVPRRSARGAYDAGAAAVFSGDAARFGLSNPLPEDEQAAREAAQFDAHCQAMPLDAMSGMVEAQRLRDATLARVALLALARTGGPVVVITGNGHARTDWGVPAVLRLAAPDVSVLSVAQLESPPEGDAPWDLWVLTDAHPRGDPCAAFQ